MFLKIAQLYYDAVGKHLTILCLFIIASAQFWAAVTAFTASSRLFYSLARDNALPARAAWMRKNQFQAPYVGVWFSVLVGIVISCAYIGSAVAFNAILSSQFHFTFHFNIVLKAQVLLSLSCFPMECLSCAG